jgi:hypothetical protein
MKETDKLDDVPLRRLRDADPRVEESRASST